MRKNGLQAPKRHQAKHLGYRLLEERSVLGVGSFSGLGGESRLNHEAHLGEFLKRGVVEEKEELQRDSEDGRCILVEVTSVSH